VTAGQPDSSLATKPALHLPSGAATRTASQMQMVQIEDYIMSLTLTDDQKAQISQIHQDMANRMHLIAKDHNETTDQKEAMIDGLKHMRLRQILLVLTPEQRSELRKKISARPSAVPRQGTMLQQTPPK
jgi:Spy/CpxP family protein refolding chaperone